MVGLFLVCCPAEEEEEGDDKPEAGDHMNSGERDRERQRLIDTDNLQICSLLPQRTQVMTRYLVFFLLKIKAIGLISTLKMTHLKWGFSSRKY